MPSLISVLSGSFHTVVTDYNESELIENLEYNIKQNIPEALNDKITVLGHTWGKDIDKVLEPIQKRGRDLFDVVIASDIIFNHVCHNELLETCRTCLHPDGVLLVVFTHHRPHKAKEDLAFFDLAEASYGLYTQKLFEKKGTPMFERDSGCVEMRSTINFLALRKKKIEEEKED